MCNVKKKLSSGNYTYSSKIEIFGIKWYIKIKNEDNKFYGIYLFRENNQK